jgi:hypothetical protein
MTLEKLQIKYEKAEGDFSETVTAMFNPEQITIGKSATWGHVQSNERDVPQMQFLSGQAASLDRAAVSPPGET